MRKTNDRTVSTFREFLKETAPFDGAQRPMPIISGRAKTFLDHQRDLLMLAKPIDDDYLSRFLQNHWIFKKRETSDPLDRTAIHTSSHVIHTVAALALLLAAVLLIGAIVNLYLVPNPEAKLGLVAMYTMPFASSITLCKNARRAEIFAATAAYAAVLVVFVSGDLGGSKNEQCLIQLEGGIWKTIRCPD